MTVKEPLSPFYLRKIRSCSYKLEGSFSAGKRFEHEILKRIILLILHISTLDIEEP